MTNINIQEIINSIKTGKMEIDLKLPNIFRENSGRSLDTVLQRAKDHLIRLLESEIRLQGPAIKELPYVLDGSFLSPITGKEYTYLLTDGTKISLGEYVESKHQLSEISTNDIVLEKGKLISDITITSGEIAIGGDNRDVENIRGKEGFKDKNDFHYSEQGALEHSRRFEKHNMFFIPRKAYASIYKNTNGDIVVCDKNHEENNTPRGAGLKYHDELEHSLDMDHSIVITDSSQVPGYLKSNQYKKIKVPNGTYSIEYDYYKKEGGLDCHILLKKIT